MHGKDETTAEDRKKPEDSTGNAPVGPSDGHCVRFNENGEMKEEDKEHKEAHVHLAYLAWFSIHRHALHHPTREELGPTRLQIAWFADVGSSGKVILHGRSLVFCLRSKN